MSDDRLADREALRELRARYSHYWDDGDVEGFVHLFTEDCILQAATQGLVRGREALSEMVAQNIHRSDFGIHFTSDEITTFTSEDTAEAVSRFAYHGGRSPNTQGAGTYVDTYRKTPDGWRFVTRHQRFFYMGERDGKWPDTPSGTELTYKDRDV